jgi:hypothetical protein
VRSQITRGLFQCATLNLTTKKAGSAELSSPFMTRTRHKVCCTFPEKEVILQLREYNPVMETLRVRKDFFHSLLYQ